MKKNVYLLIVEIENTQELELTVSNYKITDFKIKFKKLVLDYIINLTNNYNYYIHRI